MKAIMLSVHPEWVEKILNGEKTVEIRKTMPRCALPVKVYLYCTRNRHLGLVVGNGTAKLFRTCNNERAVVSGGYLGNGKVVAEFTLNKVTYLGNVATTEWKYLAGSTHEWGKELVKRACLTEEEMLAYRGKYAWHIDDLKIYDWPKEVWEFKRKCGYERNCAHADCDKCPYSCLHRAPQSWCYVNELPEGIAHEE